jgi:putative ABC transport system permease protein
MMRLRTGAVAVAARGGVARRRATTFVIGVVVLVSTAACTLALGLVVDSASPFDAAFAAQHGAHLAVTVDTALATPAQLAATGTLPGVTALSGPFGEVTVNPVIGGSPRGGGYSAPPITLVGRSSPGGPLDHLTLIRGRWPQRPGEFVLSSDSGLGLDLGAHITAGGVAGSPVLTLVGVANSVGQTADGWVLPTEVPALRAPGSVPTAQLLYRFAAAGSAAALKVDARSVASALPARTVLASQSYLAVKQQVDTGIAPVVPFVVAFGLIGLVLSVLIVVNVVSGAVVAGYRRIGVLKSIGFTPAQVVLAYASQITAPALVGCAAGVVVGNVLAVPVLGQTATVYRVGALAVPVWVDAAVPAAICCLAALAAIVPAIRAGRLSAVQAIATGRAPLQGRGYAAHRLLARLRLPRPVTIGLAAPFARPARTAVTLAAVLLGATTVTFAAGLTGSLNRVVVGLSHSRAEPVQVYPGSAGGNGPKNPVGPGRAPAVPPIVAQERQIEDALRAQPATLRYVAEADQRVNVAGLTGQVDVTEFRGNGQWTGYDMISGHWYTGPGQAVVATNFLTVTGTTVGDTVIVEFAGHQIPVRITGEVFDQDNRGLAMLTDYQTLALADPGLTAWTYDVGLRPGTDPHAYAASLGRSLGSGGSISLNTNDPFFLTLTALIALLTLLLAVVAGLGVLNTVLLHTRERVHDLGVFKAIGMTPRQSIAMVICWVAGTGLAAGLVAVPAGMAVHRYVLPAMAHAANTDVPASYIAVYTGPELALLALAGLVIAVAGALLPAGWAARAAAATALRAE